MEESKRRARARPADMGTICLPMPDDFHVHLRQGEALPAYVVRQARSFGRSLVMPNTLPPIADSAAMDRYRAQILASLPAGSSFRPLMSFKLLPGMSREKVLACAAAGAVAGKYYPSGSTTNAVDGPRSPDEVEEALETMEEAGLVLSIHGEEPEAPVLERETVFLSRVEEILGRRTRLKVVLEHLSTAQAAGFVARGPERLGATLTAHHLLYTLDDLIGGGLNPHLFCKPILKTQADREALRRSAFSGSPKFFFGSDSAPHPRGKKESASAPGGVYSAPTAVPALVGLFEHEGVLEFLPAFLAAFGAAFYGLPPVEGRLELVRRPWRVPPELDGAVPMCAGEELAWDFA